jgi:hypothetical protein
MSSEAQRFIAFVLAMGALLTSLIILVPRIFRSAGPVENEVALKLKEAEREGVTLQLSTNQAKVVATKARYDRISVHRDAKEPNKTRAVATLDFTGLLGKTEVSSLGFEEVAFVFKDGAWVVASGLAPRLVRILETLESSRQATEITTLFGPDGGVDPANILTQPGIKNRRYEVLAWYIRSEREDVLVTEKARLTGDLPDRPVDELVDRSLTLRPRGDNYEVSADL